MKNKMIKTAFLLSLLLCFSAAVHAQSSYNLEYKPAKGSTLLFKSDLNSVITQEVMGKEMKFGSDVHGIVRFLVDDVADNGDVRFISSLDSAFVKTNMMGKDTTISMESIINKHAKIVLSKTGDVKNFEMSDQLDENAGRMMSLSQELKRFFVKFPGKEIKIGESWSTTDIDTIDNLGGKIITNTDLSCTLAGKENKLGVECLKIPYAGKIKINGKGNIQGMDFNMEGEGTSTGTLYFDEKAGAFIFSEGSMNNEMTMATTGQQSMIIPITQNMKFTQSLIK